MFNISSNIYKCKFTILNLKQKSILVRNKWILEYSEPSKTMD